MWPFVYKLHVRWCLLLLRWSYLIPSNVTGKKSSKEKMQTAYLFECHPHIVEWMGWVYGYKKWNRGFCLLCYFIFLLGNIKSCVCLWSEASDMPNDAQVAVTSYNASPQQWSPQQGCCWFIAAAVKFCKAAWWRSSPWRSSCGQLRLPVQRRRT